MIRTPEEEEPVRTAWPASASERARRAHPLRERNARRAARDTESSANPVLESKNRWVKLTLVIYII